MFKQQPYISLPDLNPPQLNLSRDVMNKCMKVFDAQLHLRISKDMGADFFRISYSDAPLTLLSPH